MIKGGAVNKHCSILNYIRHADEELYELIQDLCIGRAFNPRRGSPGITFLRPDKSLLKDIKKLAEGDNPEEAVDALQALILLDNLPSINDFDDKKSDIPTFHRVKLPITSADGKKVVLQNGAEIVPDKDFTSRGDRTNISVYLISKALVPVEGEAADFSNAKSVKTKKGGAEMGALDGSFNRSAVFDLVIKNMYGSINQQRDAAMELIVALYGWAIQTKKDNLAKLIASQVTHDSLASLAIILQPYKRGSLYITEDDLKEFRKHMYGNDNNSRFRSMPVFSFNKRAMALYNELANNQTNYRDEFKRIGDKLREIAEQSNIVDSASPANAATKIGKAIQQVSSIVQSTLPGRHGLSDKEKFAEAELRVLSAVLLDNSGGDPSEEEVLELFHKCTLDSPYMLDDRSLMYGSHVGFYMSTALLVLLSGLYMIVPIDHTTENVSTSVSDVIRMNRFISLSGAIGNMRSVMLRRENSQSAIEGAVQGVNVHNI